MTKDFYQNHDFTRDRLKLWVKFEHLKNTDFKFDCKKILESIENNDEIGKFDKDEIIALNHTVTFYHTIKQLIKKEEVDIETLQDFFEYNYNRFWEPLRKRLKEDSTDGIDKKFLDEIPELKKEIKE